ncbi:hypothetical protein GCM10025867_46500 (plasmid) [Frondihabitans sucicola]|uniref:HTH cro/C1-type domain-containing protein n=2 Tax=Frondihabitans sucicola TaxID=1268041 RepID=A0ABM8GVB3_9MICO|nr:hypothetical protein GCM10025867_46500 [Frondihabitans sucicola]
MNVRSLRGKLSQQALCDLLAEKGIDWVGATLSRIETGNRGLQASEAPVLAEVLGVSVTALFDLGQDADIVGLVDWHDALASDARTLHQNARENLASQADLRARLADAVVDRELSADLQARVDQVLVGNPEHVAVNTLNLGYYRTQVECSCGTSWWYGIHEGDPEYDRAKRAHEAGGPAPELPGDRTRIEVTLTIEVDSWAAAREWVDAVAVPGTPQSLSGVPTD